MATKELDPQSYTQLPHFDAAGAIALATSLKTATPNNAPAHVKSAAKAMVKALETLKASWAGEPVPSVDDRRPADLAIDRAWAMLHARISAFGGLPVLHYPAAERAAEILRVLFPSGLTFLKLPYVQEWSESDRRLTQIVNAGLEASINELAGPQFLEQVRRTHEVYGQVLGITRASPLAQLPERAEKLRLLRRAMNCYVFSVLSMLGDDDESTEIVRQALQPIDEFRAGTYARRGSPGDDAEVIDEQPVIAPVPIRSVTPVNGPIAPAPPAMAVPAPNGTPS